VASDWKQLLREQGYRLTPQRQLVLEAVTTLGHATPDEVAAHVQAQAGAVSLSTVYRTLELLEELGLLSHAHLSHGAPTYHAADDPQHLHLVCRHCAAVTEVPVDVAASLVTRLYDEHGFDTDVRHVTVFGTCWSCAADRADGPVRPVGGPEGTESKA
jgi:Fur family transcriptional regulator, ferric uptake regulator